jgi:hypothetical protein
MRAKVTMAESLLKTLRQAQHQGWCHFLTGDPSFLSATDVERMWVPEGEVPQSPRKTIISTPKLMISIFWSPVGFPVIAVLPSITKFTASYFCDDIVPKIGEGIPSSMTTSQ